VQQSSGFKARVGIEAPPAIMQQGPARPVVAVTMPVVTAPPTPETKQSSAAAPAVVEEPKVLRRVLPAIAQGETSGNQADIVVIARIDNQGYVTGVSLAPATAPANGRLEEAAMAAARKWTFQPATVRGRAVPSEMQIRFRFAADGVHP
jgi:protein TonB